MRQPNRRNGTVMGDDDVSLTSSILDFLATLPVDERVDLFKEISVLFEETKHFTKEQEKETKRKSLEEETKHKAMVEETKRKALEEETKRKALEEETKRILGNKEFEVVAKRMRMETQGSVTATSQVNELKTTSRWRIVELPFKQLKKKFYARWGAQAKAKRTELKSHLQSLKDLTTEASIQARFGEILALFWLADTERKVVDTSKTFYLCGLAPNYTLLDANSEVGELTVQAMFKLKANKTAFTDAHLGQAWTYARLQLECQLWRRTASVALVGPDGIGILRVRRNVGESPSLGAVVSVNDMINFDNDNAVYLLDDFLHQEFFPVVFPCSFVKFPSNGWDTLSFEIPPENVVQLSATQNGTVFRFPTTTKERKEMRIVKVVAEDNLFATELSVLRKLHEAKVLNVSNLLGFSESEENIGSTKSLLFSYHGVPLTKIRIEALNVCLMKAVDILKDVHGCGIIHRDVRPANILARQDPSCIGGYDVRLIDFGLAIESQRSFKGEYVGTPAYSPQKHLEKLCRRRDFPHGFKYGRATDLESLVKTWIILMLRDELRKVVLVLGEDSLEVESSGERLLEWWRKQLEVRRDCYQAAKSKDYEGLKQFFEVNCPWNY